MRSWWTGWTEMEWGEEEGAQQEQVVHLEAHVLGLHDYGQNDNHDYFDQYSDPDYH